MNKSQALEMFVKSLPNYQDAEIRGEVVYHYELSCDGEIELEKFSIQELINRQEALSFHHKLNKLQGR